MNVFIFRGAEAPRVDAMDDLEEAERARLKDQQEKREYEERLKKRDEEHTKKVLFFYVLFFYVLFFYVLFFYVFFYAYAH